MLKFLEKEVLTSQPSSKYIRTHKEMIKCCSCKFVQWQNSSDLPQQFRNERHDGNFQQHSIQVQSLADMLGDSHGLLGGGCAMWSLKIDGRIPSFNEIGPLQLLQYTILQPHLSVRPKQVNTEYTEYRSFSILTEPNQISQQMKKAYPLFGQFFTILLCFYVTIFSKVFQISNFFFVYL